MYIECADFSSPLDDDLESDRDFALLGDDEELLEELLEDII